MSGRGESVETVRAVLREAGVESPILELPDSTRTSAEAAQAVGCGIAQIAKSIVFTGRDSGRGVVVVASGVNRINEQAIAEFIDEPVAMATPEFVRRTTGFAIGGVPPFGLRESMTVLIDRDLLRFGEIWAAAGTPHAVVRLTPGELTSLAGGAVVEVT